MRTRAAIGEIGARVTRERSRNVELGRPCDRRPANQLFSFVVPPSSFPVRVHAEAAGPTGWQVEREYSKPMRVMRGRSR